MSFSLPYAVMQPAVAAYATQLGASPKTILYAGTVPASASAALGSATALATLTAAATPIASYADTGTAARAVWAAIPSVTVTTTGSAAFFRDYASDGVTVKGQGTIGIAGSGADMILNTTALTAGSGLAVSSRTTDFPYGP